MFSKAEKSHSIHGHGEKWNENKCRVENISEIGPDTAIKLIRKNCMRLANLYETQFRIFLYIYKKF